MNDKNNLYSFSSNKGPAIAVVELSSNFREQTDIWATGKCILRRYDAANPNVALIEIPGQALPLRVHKTDFTIVG